MSHLLPWNLPALLAGKQSVICCVAGKECMSCAWLQAPAVTTCSEPVQPPLLRRQCLCMVELMGKDWICGIMQVEEAEGAVPPQQQEQQRQQQQEWFDVMEEIAVGGDRLGQAAQPDHPAEVPAADRP